MRQFFDSWPLVLVAVLFGVMACSCANITPVYDSSGRVVEVKSTKFLADLEYSRHVKYNEVGAITEEHITYKTMTNMDRIMGEGGKILNTVAGVARDMMP